MTFKVGLHFNHTPSNVERIFEQWPMTCAVILDHSPDVWRRCKKISPRTVFVGRVTPDQGYDWESPATDLLKIVEARCKTLGQYAERMDGIIDYWIPFNEPVVKTRRAMERYADVCIEITSRLAFSGIRVANGGFAEGNPAIGLWQYYIDALRVTLKNKGIGHVHEYDYPTILNSFPWRTGRILQVIHGNTRASFPVLEPQPQDEWPGLPADLKNLRWMVTELGLDGTDHTPAGQNPYGWKQLTHPTGCASDLISYNACVLSQPHFIGGAAYAIATPPWENFDLTDVIAKLTEIADNLGIYYATPASLPEPVPQPPSPVPSPPVTTAVIRPRLGICTRNSLRWSDLDFDLFAEARLELAKVMSVTELAQLQRLRVQHPDVPIIVRLYDQRFSVGGVPGVTEFVERFAPYIRACCGMGILDFEIHNEPNHAAGIEGFGSSDAHAQSFLAWYTLALATLREACPPEARFGFPGLAVPSDPHNDLRWLDICRSGILDSDWLGCHCYWQYSNQLNPDFGMRFKQYHARFPQMPIHITECGDSTPLLGPETQAGRLANYYDYLVQNATNWPYLRSVAAFIASSPDPQWESFTWIGSNGAYKPIVRAVAGVDRPPIAEEETEPLEPQYYPWKDISGTLRWNRKRPPLRRDLSQITHIIIHHSAVATDIPEANIADYHVLRRDYRSIAYHLCCRSDGTVVQTLPFNRVGSHIAGFNTPSIGIMLHGNFMKNSPPRAQIDATRRAIQTLCDLFHISTGNIYGHRYLPEPKQSTRCPGDTYPKWSALIMPDGHDLP